MKLAGYILRGLSDRAAVPLKLDGHLGHVIHARDYPMVRSGVSALMLLAFRPVNPDSAMVALEAFLLGSAGGLVVMRWRYLRAHEMHGTVPRSAPPAPDFFLKE